MVVLAVVTKVPTYRVAPAFLLPILWGVYLLRRWLDMPPLHFGLFAAALLLHNLGALGWYQKWPLGFSFDIVVHFSFAFAAGFIVFRTIAINVPALRPWQVYVATFLFIMGFGAIHELMEYASTLWLGEERGMLKTTGYKFDTQRDLLNNLLGVSLALVFVAIGKTIRGGDAQTGFDVIAPERRAGALPGSS